VCQNVKCEQLVAGTCTCSFDVEISVTVRLRLSTVIFFNPFKHSLHLNPLSLTSSRLPRVSANERRIFPHALAQKGKKRGESDISEMKLSDFPCFSSNFLGKKTVWWRVARKTASQTRLTGNTPRRDRRRKRPPSHTSYARHPKQNGWCQFNRAWRDADVARRRALPPRGSAVRPPRRHSDRRRAGGNRVRG